jgi:DNA-binding response OmpR family regulator
MVARIPEPKTILAVDSDAQALNSLMARLSAAGYDVLSAMSNADALRITQARQVDAIIVRTQAADGADGFQIAQELRTASSVGLTPIILLCENGNRALRDKCTDVGLLSLPEPFDNERLTRTLAAAMARGGFTEVPCQTNTSKKQ